MSLHSPVWVVQQTQARGPNGLLLVTTRTREGVYECEVEGRDVLTKETFYGSRLMAQDRCAKMAEEHGK